MAYAKKKYLDYIDDVMNLYVLRSERLMRKANSETICV